MRPNIIFVVLDTLRADLIFKNQNNHNLTPFMQSILENSLYFENCIANSPWTLPSHISMFTSLYPTQNALISNDLGKVDIKIPILPEIMKNIGYFTMAYIENPWVNKLFGLTRGFIKCFSNEFWTSSFWNREKFPLFRVLKILNILNSNEKKRKKFTIFRRLRVNFSGICIRLIKELCLTVLKKQVLFKLKDNSIGNLTKVVSVLKKNLSNDKPLFFFLNFMITHDPYIPLEESFNRFNIDLKNFKKIRGLIVDPLKFRFKIDFDSKKLSNNEVKVIEKLYGACVYSADIVIKRLFSLLEKFKILENSYVIIASDHGEHLGGKQDHYLWEHSTYQSLYDSVLRVPLIIFHQNFTKKIIKEQVQLKDIFHTILDLTGTPNSTFKYFDKKKSILYQIDNNSTPEYIFGEYSKSKNDIDIIMPYLKNIDKPLLSKILSDLYFLRSNTYKYIKFKNIDYEQFYDISIDPFEHNNISNINNEELKKMRNLLKVKLENINQNDDLKSLITGKEEESITNILKTLNFRGI